MTYVDVLCLMKVVPSSNSGVDYSTKGSADAEDWVIKHDPQLEPVLVDLATGLRPSRPIESKCKLALPRQEGSYIAHIAVDETCGIMQEAEWNGFRSLLF